MNKAMVKLAIFLGAVCFVIPVVLGIFWLLWSAWCWVLPQIYADGPQNVVRPSYWLFVIAWILASWIGRAIFGSRK